MLTSYLISWAQCLWLHNCRLACKILAGAYYYQQHLAGALEPNQGLAGLAPRQIPATGWLLFQRHNHPIESERSPKF